MPPGPIFPPGIREVLVDIVIMFAIIIGVFAIFKLLNPTRERTTYPENEKTLEIAIKEMTEEIRGLRKDIEELKEELKD